MLTDVEGASSLIRYLPPNMPNKGLGFYITADSNQEQEFERRLSSVKEMCAAAASISLSQREAHIMLQSRLVAQTSYTFRLTQFSPEKCHDLDVITNETFLPRMTINRRTPRALVHGPIELGGMAIPTKFLALQTNGIFTL